MKKGIIGFGRTGHNLHVPERVADVVGSETPELVELGALILLMVPGHHVPGEFGSVIVPVSFGYHRGLFVPRLHEYRGALRGSQQGDRRAQAPCRTRRRRSAHGQSCSRCRLVYSRPLSLGPGLRRSPAVSVGRGGPAFPTARRGRSWTWKAPHVGRFLGRGP